jgi:hypothetical protein
MNSLPQIPAHELRVPIDMLKGARYNVLLCRIDCPGEGFRPIRHPLRPHSFWPPPPCFHQFVSHPAKEEGISPNDVFYRVTVDVFVRDHYAMITATV